MQWLDAESEDAAFLMTRKAFFVLSTLTGRQHWVLINYYYTTAGWLISTCNKTEQQHFKCDIPQGQNHNIYAALAPLNNKAQCRCALWYTVFGDTAQCQSWSSMRLFKRIRKCSPYPTLWIINHCDKRTITAVFISPQIEISVIGEATYLMPL